MAADTGKKPSLALQLDKISYGAALVVAIVVLLVPVMASRSIKDTDNELLILQDKIKDRQKEEVPPPPVPDLAGTIRGQWSVVPPPDEHWISGWTPEVRPGLVKLTQESAAEKAQHEPGKILKISYERDAAKMKVFLRIEAAKGNMVNVTLAKATLLRADEGSEEFKQVAELPESLKHDDYDVVPGKKYSYKLVTRVSVDPAKKVELPKDLETKESEPLAMTEAIPYDYAINILTATPFDVTTGAPPSLNGEIKYWDYAADKEAKKSNLKWEEGNTFGPTVAGKERYKIASILEGKVVVQVVATLEKETVTVKDNRRPVVLPKPVTETVAKAGDGSGVEETPPAAAEEPKTKKKAEPAKKDEKKDKAKKPAGKKEADKKKKPRASVK